MPEKMSKEKVLIILILKLCLYKIFDKINYRMMF